MAHPTKMVSLSLDLALYRQCKRLARQRGQSISEFVAMTLQQTVIEGRQLELRAAFAQLATSDANVEYAFGAQSEVVVGQIEGRT